MEMVDGYAEIRDPWSMSAPPPPPSLSRDGQDNRYDERAYRGGFQPEYVNQLGVGDNNRRDWQQQQQDEVMTYPAVFKQSTEARLNLIVKQTWYVTNN
jgi:hypothetical protein